MGVKRLLDKITITDSSDTNNDGNVDFVTCVYDEDDDLIEVYDIEFDQITSSSIGFRGEYFDGGTYSSVQNRTFSDGITGTVSGVAASSTLNRIYVIDGTNIRVYNIATSERVSSEEITSNLTAPVDIAIKESTSQLLVTDGNDLKVFETDGTLTATYGNSPSFTNSLEGVYYEASSDLAYVCNNGGITSIQTINVSTGSFGQVNGYGGGNLTAPVDVWVTSDRVYVVDDSQNEVVVFNKSFVNQSSEDLPSSLFSNCKAIVISGDLAYVADGLDLVAITLSTQTEDTTRTVSTVDLSSIIHLGATNNSVFISSDKAGGDVVYETSIATYPTTLVYPNARDFVNENIGTYWRRNPTNYIYRDGDDYVYFQPFTAPPYFLKRSAPLSGLEVVDEDLADDLEASITAFTYPTSNTATNGSITVTATGTHTPFTYQIIGPNNSNESPQASGTFNNLTAGNYSFRIIDDNNVILDLPPFNLPWVEEVLDDYGVLYDFEWFDVTGTNEFKLEIVKKGYAGSTTTLTDMGDPPFTLSLNPNGSDIVDTHIVSLNASITLVSDTIYDYLEISQGNDEDYAVIFYVHDGMAFSEYWRGMISPRSYSETLSGVNHYTTFTATDRIGDLQNLKYRQKIDSAFGSSTYDPDFKSYYGGKKTLFQILHYCMRQLNMNMGYRIAINLFEDSHNTAASDDPLNQTKVDTDSYFDDNNDMTLQEVVTHIIKPFKAYMVGYDGYWYIIDKENLSSSSISYVEYDETGTYVTNSNWSPRIDYGTPSASNRFRWVNDAQVSTTEVYKDILLTLDTKVINKGRLTSEFIAENRLKLSIKNSAPRYLNFKGWNFFLGSGENVDRFIYKSGVRRGALPSPGTIRIINFTGFNPNPTPPDEKYDWVFKQSPEGGGNSRIVYNKKITTGPSDDFELNIKVTSGLNNAFRISGAADEQDLSLDVPYIKLRWKMKVGSYYYNYTTGNWTVTDTTNEFFINSPSEQNFNVTFNTPPVAQSETNYRLTVYPADVTDYDLDGGSTEAAMLTALKAVDTTVLSTGSRLIARYKDTSGGTDVYIHHYYELQYNIESGSEPDVVDPDDFNSSSNPKRWRLVALKSYLGYDLAEIIGYHTVTYFKDISLRLLPNGSEAPEEANLKWKLDDSNKVTYEETLYHFDAPPNINSAMELFFNHFFTGTRTPTDNWSKSGGIDRRIQDHFLRWLAKKLKRTRFVVNGDIHYNTLPTPISVFRDTGDDNALYMIAGGSFDFKQNMITGGTFVEIERDTAVSISSVTSGFDSTGIE